MARVAGVEVSLDHYLGGARVPSPRRFADVSPIDEHVLGDVARGGATEARLAVDSALEAFEKWGRTPPVARAAALHRIADGIESRLGVLAALETEDNGALLRSHLRGVMPRVVHNFRFFADWLLQLGHDDVETRGHRNHVSWDPAGVAVLITPWNAPLMLATWKIAPALAAGDTVVLKPAEWSPLSASLLADITAEAGLPPGVFNVVQGIGEEAGDALVSDPRVARISFTGSVTTARHIAARAAANLVPVSFELGGKSPLLVFSDADMGLAVDLAVQQVDNAGQVCLACTRLLVDAAIIDDFTARLCAAMAGLRQGDPRDPDVDVGPLITRAHLERVDGFVRRAVADGAQVLVGGGPNTDLGGLFYLPTLIGGARRVGDLDRGGLRSGSHHPAVRLGGRGGQHGQLHPFRSGGDRRDVRRGARRAGRVEPGRRDRVGELLLRARPARAVRGIAPVGHRAGGGTLELRLLLRRQEHGVRTEDVRPDGR